MHLPSRSGPTSSRSPRHQRGGAIVWLLVLLLLASAGLAAWWFLLRGGSGQAEGLLRRAIPAEATVIGGLDPEVLLESQVIADAAAASGQSIEALKAGLTRAGFDLETLQAVVIGHDPASGETVLATQGKLDIAALKGALLALSAASPALGEVLSGAQFEGLDHGLVVAGTGELYTKALAVARGNAEAGLDPRVSRVARAVDMGGAVWAAGALPAAVTEDLGPAATQLGGTPTHAAISVAAGRTVKVELAVLAPGMDGATAAANLGAMWRLAGAAI